MARPNFFIVGAPKCGTTAWVEYLSSHPDVAFSTDKEPHYFNTDLPGFRWVQTEADYLQQFSHAGSATRVGEASVQYLYSEDAARNISRFSPDAKILIFLREPAPFLRSYHNQLLVNLDEDETDLAKAWALSGCRNEETLPITCREPKLLNYKRVGRFAEQVQRYLDCFPADQIKIIWFEDWCQNPRDAYLGLMEYLEIEDDGRSEFPVIHSAKKNTSAFVAKLVQRPPEWALKASSAFKGALGKQRLGLADTLRAINKKQGYATEQRNPELEQEISNFFAADYTALRMRDGVSAKS